MLQIFKIEFSTKKQADIFITLYVRKQFSRYSPTRRGYFYLWEHLKPVVYSVPIENKETLQCILYACQTIRKTLAFRTFENLRQAVIRRFQMCIALGEEHFEHLLLIVS
jgi:hypothetical protein